MLWEMSRSYKTIHILLNISLRILQFYVYGRFLKYRK